MKQISSIHNTYIKSLVFLKEKAKSRHQKGFFLIEGHKEISLAIKVGYEIERILFYPQICAKHEIKKWSDNSELIEISKDVYKKLAYRKTTEGVIGVAKIRKLSLASLKIGSNSLILIAESIEKPGNIGALLHTADAANIDAVIIANPKCDLYNPNLVRSSLGCLFTNQIATGTTTEIINFLKENKISIYCANLQNANSYHTQDYTASTAIVVGNENMGLSKEWRDAATKNVIIPMHGKVDSMNVSVSAAILIFEAKRQRGF